MSVKSGLAVGSLLGLAACGSGEQLSDDAATLNAVAMGQTEENFDFEALTKGSDDFARYGPPFAKGARATR